MRKSKSCTNPSLNQKKITFLRSELPLSKGDLDNTFDLFGKDDDGDNLEIDNDTPIKKQINVSSKKSLINSIYELEEYKRARYETKQINSRRFEINDLKLDVLEDSERIGINSTKAEISQTKHLHASYNNKNLIRRHNIEIEVPVLYESIINTKKDLVFHPTNLTDHPKFSREMTNSQNHDKFSCTICFSEIELTEKINSTITCKHYFCRQCLEAYIKIKILNKEVINIRCPKSSCQSLIPDEIIEKLLEEKDYKKYLDLKKIQELMSNPYLRWCNQPDCSKYIIGNEKNLSSYYMKCTCGNEICFNCNEKWHPGKTCQELLIIDFKELAKESKIKLCPKCKTRSEKDEGCNHMTCTICKYEYCWICLEEYNLQHFDMDSTQRCKKINWKAIRNLSKCEIIKDFFLSLLKAIMKIMGLLMIFIVVLFLSPILLLVISGYISIGFSKRHSPFVKNNEEEIQLQIDQIILCVIGMLLSPILILIYLVVKLLKRYIKTVWIYNWINWSDNYIMEAFYLNC